jgi:hypothetical protein
MELLVYVGHVETCFGPFGDNVSFGARYVHSLCQAYLRLRNRFGRTRWYALVMRLKWMLVSFRFEIVLTLTQHRCTICAERTIASQIFLDALDGTPR